jgi:VWFA-related protein
LKPNDFVVLENSLPQNVLKFSPVPPITNTAIILDCSASLTKKNEIIKNAVRRFIEADDSRPDDRFAIICAANHTQQYLLSPLTNDREMINQGIDQYIAWGGTYLAEGIGRAMAYLKAVVPGEFNQVVIFSDGQDKLSQSELKETLALAGQSETLINVIGIKNQQTTQTDIAYLQALASQTGGVYVAVDKTTDLDMAFSEMTVDVASRYTFWFQSGVDPKSNEKRDIEVRIPSHPEYKLSYQNNYYGTSAGAALTNKDGVISGVIPPFPPLRDLKVLRERPNPHSLCREGTWTHELGERTLLYYKGNPITLAPTVQAVNQIPKNRASYVELSDPEHIVGTCYLENRDDRPLVLRKGAKFYVSFKNMSARYLLSTQNDTYINDTVGILGQSYTANGHYYEDTFEQKALIRCQLPMRNSNHWYRLKEVRPLIEQIFKIDFSETYGGGETECIVIPETGGHS